MFDSYQQVDYSLRPRTACCKEYSSRSVAEMYFGKQCLAGIKTLVQSPVCRMDTREMAAMEVANTAAPQRVPRDKGAFAIPKTFLTNEGIILKHTGMLCQLSTTSRQNIWDSIQLLPKRLSMALVSLQVRVTFNINLRWKMTWSICFTTRYHNKTDIIMLKKRC